MNLGNMMNIYHKMRTNPTELLSQRFNLPQDIDATNPNNIIQHLLDTGQVTQNQLNQARNNPIVQMFMK